MFAGIVTVDVLPEIEIDVTPPLEPTRHWNTADACCTLETWLTSHEKIVSFVCGTYPEEGVMTHVGATDSVATHEEVAIAPLLAVPTTRHSITPTGKIPAATVAELPATVASTNLLAESPCLRHSIFTLWICTGTTVFAETLVAQLNCVSDRFLILPAKIEA